MPSSSGSARGHVDRTHLATRLFRTLRDLPRANDERPAVRALVDCLVAAFAAGGPASRPVG
jgi:hypothetical protein